MADEGVLVEALAPIGPDDEQVDDEDGEPGAEPEPDQAARESPPARAHAFGATGDVGAATGLRVTAVWGPTCWRSSRR